MKMTRQHFQAIADSLNKSRPDINNVSATTQWHRTIQDMADMLEQTNLGFKRDAFIGACFGK